MKLTFDVKNQILSRTDRQNVIANSTDYLEAEVTFSEDWNGLEKNMSFVSGDTNYTYVLEEAENDKWVIAQNQHLNLGIGTWKASIIGVSGDKRIVTNAANVAIRASGWIGVDGPLPSVYEQLLVIIQSLHTEAVSTAVIRSAVQQYIVDNYDALVKEVVVIDDVRSALDDMAEDGSLSALLDPLVAEKLPEEVADQIGGVVAAQIGGTVANQLPAEVTRQIGTPTTQAVNTYCAENFSEWSGGLDSTLTQPLMAAPADKVGEIKSALTNIENIYFLSGGTGTSNASKTYSDLESFIYSLTILPFSARSGLPAGYYVLRVTGVKSDTTEVVIITQDYSAYDGNKKVISIDNRTGTYSSIIINIRATNGTTATIALEKDFESYYDAVTDKNASDIEKNETLANNGMILTEANNVVIGGLNYSTGAESTANNRARTGFMKVENGYTVFNHTDYIMSVFFYSTNNVSGFISATNLVSGKVLVPNTASYVRLLFAKADRSTFASSDLPTIYKNAYAQYVKEDFRHISCNFVRGSIDATTGEENSSYARVRCEYIQCSNNIKLVNNSGLIGYVYLYTYSKKLVKVYDATYSANIQHVGYIRLVLKKTDSSNFDDTDILNANNNFILISNANDLPLYWSEYMPTKYDAIQQHGLSMKSKGDSIIFLTDTHYENNYLMSPLLIKSILKNTNISKIVCGGDVINGNNDKNKALGMMESWFKLFGENPYALAVGNHDTNTSIGTSTSSNSISNGEVYDLADRQLERFVNTNAETYFYFDNPSQKIRYFVLNTGDGNSAQTTHVDDPIDYSAELTWLTSSISDIDNTWHIIVFQHLFFNGQSIEQGGQVTVSPVYGETLMTVLNAINADENKPTVFAVVVGHVHRDYSILAEGGYYCISTTCDAGGTSASNYDPDNPTRTQGTTSEQAFDVFQFDINNKKIYATRIGAGQNRLWEYE